MGAVNSASTYDDLLHMHFNKYLVKDYRGKKMRLSRMDWSKEPAYGFKLKRVKRVS